jgi:ABC-type transport system involved in multi-copper enzyme maturation permease subunit
MLSLFHAEWQKTVGNRMVVLPMIWVFPMAAAAGVAIMILSVLISSHARALFGSEELALAWTSLMPEIWRLPNSGLGRMLLVGFAAVVFAGEYQWRTWKSIIPRSHRLALILCKFLAVGVFVVLAFVSVTAILGIGTGMAVRLAGGTCAKLTPEVLTDFAGDFALQAALTFISTTIVAGYAALAGMYTRSILGGVMIGLGATTADQFSLVGLSQIGALLRFPRIVELYRLTPAYNLANVTSWISNGSSGMMPFGFATDSLTVSLAVLAGWVLGLIVLTAFLFQRQDIVS